MNGVDPDPPGDDIDALAGEFVLGLLDAEGEARVAQLRRRDGRFDAAVATWTAHLMTLADAVAPVAPPARIWRSLEAATTRRRAVRLWEDLKFWRYFGLGAGASALAAAALALFLLHTPVPAPTAVATLAMAGGGTFIATAQKSGGGILLVISPARVTVPAGKSAELWLLLPQQKPRALGLLKADLSVMVALAEDRSFGHAALAISLEPPGGSPTGAPTGPVVASANFLPL